MTGQIAAKDIGRGLITAAVAIAGSAVLYITQIENIETRVTQLEKHENFAHPPDDYRKLMDERIRRLREDLNRYELKHNNPERD